jgi:cell division transport system permease protein
MFILPLIAILLGIEFYLVFDRTTASYEKGLKDGYSMLVVTTKPVTLNDLKVLNSHIGSIESIKRKNIVSQITQGIGKESQDEILKQLPYFYDVRLDEYVPIRGLNKIKQDLESSTFIKRVETFGSSYSSSYRLFSFIKFILKLFIFFISIVSVFLIVKQMEIWKYEHRQRMKVMEIFGASLMLRSGILFRMAIVDAFFATVLTSAIFLYIKFEWAPISGIDILMQKQDELFDMNDMGLLFLSSLCIVIFAVYSVVISNKGVEE